MNILETYYTYAKLSQAAYIDLSPAQIASGSPFSSDVIAQAAASQNRVPRILANDIFGAGDFASSPN